MRNILVLLLFYCYLPAVDAQQLYFNHLSVNNGLSQGVNNCIVKDSKGFVWISSFDGLNRFDGIDCRKYYASTDAEKGIKGTLFLNMLEDKAGNMWIGSNKDSIVTIVKTTVLFVIKLTTVLLNNFVLHFILMMPAGYGFSLVPVFLFLTRSKNNL